MTTFGTLKSHVASDMERTLADAAMAGETWGSVIGRYINDSIQMLKGKHWWFIQEPTSAALTSLTIADNSYVPEYTGLISLESLRITISGQLWELDPIDFAEMQSRHDGTANSNQPYEYNRWGKRVRLYPTPNQAYTLTWAGLFEQVVLSADADTNDWCTHGALVVKAQAKLKLYRDYIKDLEAATAANVELAEAVMSLDREHIRRMSTTRIQARS